MTEKRILNALGQVDGRFIEEAAPTGVKAAKTPRRRSYTGLKRALLIAATALATVCCLFMLNANVRAAIAGVFTGKDSHGWNVVSFGDPDEKNGFDITKVTLNYVPDGMMLPEAERIELKYGGDRSPYFRIIGLALDEPRVTELYGSYPHVNVCIYRTESFNMKYSDEGFATFEEYYTPTMVRGMFGFRCSFFDDGEETGSLIFGDGNVTVQIDYDVIGMDEVMKIAEGIVW